MKRFSVFCMYIQVIFLPKKLYFLKAIGVKSGFQIVSQHLISSSVKNVAVPSELLLNAILQMFLVSTNIKLFSVVIFHSIICKQRFLYIKCFFTVCENVILSISNVKNTWSYTSVLICLNGVMLMLLIT